jgi:hypothetical protein
MMASPMVYPAAVCVNDLPQRRCTGAPCHPGHVAVLEAGGGSVSVNITVMVRRNFQLASRSPAPATIG